MGGAHRGLQPFCLSPSLLLVFLFLLFSSLLFSLLLLLFPLSFLLFFASHPFILLPTPTVFLSLSLLALTCQAFENPFGPETRLEVSFHPAKLRCQSTVFVCVCRGLQPNISPRFTPLPIFPFPPRSIVSRLS
ncbi:hypothetical protein BO78DRAFT_226784 [Aspergillus sclerotiicarbonarius CBS 121057]|uniref:Uncharacterized protein n=1 Tax=Aspergillus sclerotiicarbonarius (strain CBS 121057 / IBT 28362) TaxID=1448318 RepID=A0A319DWC3_ASPSB|nr:hypothetical protein BO78DRAFT_226784 [Aspergillus sclerotiicarbonarius CBS 121057]